jgi:hypothetical protein
MVRNKTTTVKAAKAKPTPVEGKKKGRKAKADIERLKPAAMQLYLLGKTFKEIGPLVGVDEKYISKWADAEGWSAHRAVITTSKPQLLKSLYGQCKAMTDAIDAKPENERYADSKQADSLIKLTGAIKNLEGEANISQVIEVGISIGDYCANFKPEHTQVVVDVFQAFLTHRLSGNN